MQLPRSLVATMEMFVLLKGQMIGRGGWRCALEECGELCVMIAGTPVMLVWCAGSWASKWMCHGDVSCFLYPNMDLHESDASKLFIFYLHV